MIIEAAAAGPFYTQIYSHKPGYYLSRTCFQGETMPTVSKAEKRALNDSFVLIHSHS